MTDVSIPAGSLRSWAIPADLIRLIVVAAATLAMVAGFGLTATVALMVKPFEAESGWLRADIAFSYTLLCAGAALGGLVAGWANDRLDTRPIVVFGTAVIGAGLVAISRQNDLGLIQTIYLAVGVFGFACLYTPVLATVSLWFDARRGLAMGIVTAGGALGQGILPVLMQPIIAAQGWRFAFAALGLVYLILLAPLMLFLRKPPALPANEAGAPVPPASRAWALPPVAGIAWMSLAALFCCATMAVPLVHLLALFADRGLSDSLGGSLVLIIMLAASVGRIVFGMAADRFGVVAAYAASVLLQTVTLYGFVSVSVVWLYGLAILFGFGFGGVMTTLLLCARATVSAEASGRATSLVTLFAWVGMGVGAYQGGYCFDLSGSYAVSFASAALAGIANLIVISGLWLHLRHYERRRVAQA